MIDYVLFCLHYVLLLLCGVVLSAAFCGVKYSKKNLGILVIIYAICGILQLSAFIMFGEAFVWKIYPFIIHLPLCILLVLFFKKRVISVAASVFLAYLSCEPSNWFGMLAETLTGNPTIVWLVKIATMLIVSLLLVAYFSSLISEIFSKDTRSILIFGIMPFVYYLFDYTVGIYTDLWLVHARLSAEFLAFFLCVMFMSFCIIYYREYERKMEIEQKNQIVEITVQQQAKEIEAIRKSNYETALLRHDMRLLLSNLALIIEQDDKDNALKIISGYVDSIESATLHRYCGNDTVNYILTNFESKCSKVGISFQADIEIDTLPVDEIMFSSIISNALDNALNAQMLLPEKERYIKLLLKPSYGKLLLSVKNPFRPVPVPPKTPPHAPGSDGHGYGTKSIVYMTEKLGGNCQFSTRNNVFILRAVL